MKRGSTLVLFGVVGALAAASSAKAQSPYIFLGAGASLPMRDFKNDAKLGWMAQAGVGLDLSKKGLWVEAEAFYGSNKHKAPDDADKTNLLALLGAVGYSFTPDKKVSPYVLAAAGMLNHKFVPGTGTSESESKFAYSGAVGIGYNASERVHVWLEGRYLGAGKDGTIPVTLGVSVSFGKSGM